MRRISVGDTKGRGGEFETNERGELFDKTSHFTNTVLHFSGVL